MAYNAQNEERKELIDIKKNERGDHIVVTKITNKANGNTSIDLRNYYTTEDGEVRPTQKGIRVNTEFLLDLIVAMTDGLEANELFDLQDKLEEIIEDGEESEGTEEMTGLNDDMPPMD